MLQRKMSALICAIQGKASPEVVKLLLENNADTTAIDKVLDFCIALAHFCRLIQSAVLAFILLYHISRSFLYYKNCANFLYFFAQNGETVLMIGVRCNASTETMQLLLDSGAADNINAQHNVSHLCFDPEL